MRRELRRVYLEIFWQTTQQIQRLKRDERAIKTSTRYELERENLYHIADMI
jgi:hypothetical protein